MTMLDENKDIVAMIVDDHMVMRNLLESTLRSMGIQNIIHAKDAKNALKFFNLRKPDIIFLDINMPDMNGIDALKVMLSIDETAFVTMISAENTVDNVKNSIGNGAQGFIVKPYAPEKIISIVDKFNSSSKFSD